MNLSVINRTNQEITDEQVQLVIRAINRQIKEDFELYWSLGATLRLEGVSGNQPDNIYQADMRGDAVIYISGGEDIPNVLGYHDRNFHRIPFGFVFTAFAEELGESWTVALSREVLNLILDREVHQFVGGPHPDLSQGLRTVFHWYEACRAVQAETYIIDGVEVSNFVLPGYFIGGDEFEGRNDFLSKVYNGKYGVRAFGVNPGGYVGFFDPNKNDFDIYFDSHDKEAERRLYIEKKAEGASRIYRYQRFIGGIEPGAGNKNGTFSANNWRLKTDRT